MTLKLSVGFGKRAPSFGYYYLVCIFGLCKRCSFFFLMHFIINIVIILAKILPESIQNRMISNLL